MKRYKKVIALLCSASLGLMSLAGCGKTKEAQQEEIVEDVQEIEDVMQGFLGTSLIKHSATAGKEETVYVMLDADGNQTSTVVSEWLKNADGTESLQDISRLEDIHVVKGSSTFQRDGEHLTWSTGGSDVYYQGASQEEPPISVKISYMLDGKPVKAKDLEGASGHLTITFNYENHTGRTQEIHGEERTIYVPFVVISGMIFDNDKVMNVEVSDGKTVNSGDKTFVFGVAMPGLADSLGIDEMENDEGKKLDLDIPEQVVVDADVTDFSLLMTLSIASNEALERLGLDDFDSLDDLKEDMDQLTDGMDDLIDGTARLTDGVQELSDGTGELSDGTDDLQSGASSLADGANQLLNGTYKIGSGVTSLRKGIDAADKGANDLKNGMDQLQAKIPTLTSGVTQLQAGITQLSGGLDTLDGKLSDPTAQAQMAALQQGSASVQEGLSAASAGLDQIVAGYDPESEDLAKLIGSLNAYAAGLEATGDANNAAYAKAIRTMVGTYQSMYGNVKTATAGVDALNEAYPGVDAGIGSMVDNMSTISGAVKKAATGAGQVKDGLDAMNEQLPVLSDGVNALTKGAGDLAEGTGKLKKGALKLEDGTDDLKEGALNLAEGAGKLSDGTNDLKDGVKELVDGVAELLDGSGELKDGVMKFNDEGISKLSDLVNEDLEKFYDRLQAVRDYSEEYKSFGGCRDDVECSVQFNYKSDSIGE